MQPKKLSNSISTGGGGGHFEKRVQASYVVLMLSGGYAPCMPCWPITQISVQGKINGFETDDLIVYTESFSGNEQAKMLAQIKHSIKFIKNDKVLEDVLNAAWIDYNNRELFNKDTDIISLITGPLSGTDTAVKWLLEHARSTTSWEEFNIRVNKANFSPPKSKEKLSVIFDMLKKCNLGVLDNHLFYEFLKRFYLIGYDLNYEYGVILSLIHSHISQYEGVDAKGVWGKIVDEMGVANRDARSLRRNTISKDIIREFDRSKIVHAPDELNHVAVVNNFSLNSGSKEQITLTLFGLVGGWDESNKNDFSAIKEFINGI